MVFQGEVSVQGFTSLPWGFRGAWSQDRYEHDPWRSTYKVTRRVKGFEEIRFNSFGVLLYFYPLGLVLATGVIRVVSVGFELCSPGDQSTNLKLKVSVRTAVYRFRVSLYPFPAWNT